MIALHITFILLMFFGAILEIADVGKPKKPTTPLTTAIIVAIQMALIVWTVMKTPWN